MDKTAGDFDRYVSTSSKILVDDLDWSEARRVSLTRDEVFILTYFSDIESQTVFYLRDLLHTKAAKEPEVLGFLTMWNYEEFFHGRALARLLAECGHPLEDERISHVRRRSQVSEVVEALGAKLISKLFRNQFPSVYMSWGATQEITTLRGYEQLGRHTRNPVLREICERIAKQERRHFAWYFNGARARLEQSRLARRLTRTLLERFWSPVGAGVKTKAEVVHMIGLLFPGRSGDAAAEEIDATISRLPGLAGIRLMRPYLSMVTEEFARLFPATT
jgi:hypothetical protein